MFQFGLQLLESEAAFSHVSWGQERRGNKQKTQLGSAWFPSWLSCSLFYIMCCRLQHVSTKLEAGVHNLLYISLCSWLKTVRVLTWLVRSTICNNTMWIFRFHLAMRKNVSITVQVDLYCNLWIICRKSWNWTNEVTVLVQCHELNTCGVTSEGADEMYLKKYWLSICDHVFKLFRMSSYFSKSNKTQKHERKNSNIANSVNNHYYSRGVNTLSDPLTVCLCNSIFHPIARFQYDLMKVNKNTNYSQLQHNPEGSVVQWITPSPHKKVLVWNPPTSRGLFCLDFACAPRDYSGSIQVLGHP